MSGEGTRRAIEAERARIRAKVQPEVDAAWAAMEEQQARDTEESRAVVARHQQRERERLEARARKAADEEAEWQRLLTDDAGRVSMEPGQSESSRSSGSSKSKEGQMPKLEKKTAAKAKAAPVAKAKAEKKATYCLMTGKQTTGARFSGLGTDAKYKSLLINTALGDPKAEVTIYDHETGEKSMQSAISILKALNWVPFLEKSRASRKAKVEAKNAASSAKVAKKAAGKTEAS